MIKVIPLLTSEQTGKQGLTIHDFVIIVERNVRKQRGM